MQNMVESSNPIKSQGTVWTKLASTSVLFIVIECEKVAQYVRVEKDIRHVSPWDAA